jgi:hypothetical protein
MSVFTAFENYNCVTDSNISHLIKIIKFGSLPEDGSKASLV